MRGDGTAAVVVTPLDAAPRWRQQALLFAGALAWLLFLLAMVTHSTADPAFSTSGEGGALNNKAGLLGARVADMALFLFGFSAWWLLPLCLRAWLSALAILLRPWPPSLAALLTSRAVGRFCASETLLEVADLLLHEAARLLFLLRLRLVVAAVRAASPTFWIRLLAGFAGDAFRQRHPESARIVHFGQWTKTAAGRWFRSSNSRLETRWAAAGTTRALPNCCGPNRRPKNCAS